jgi:hypothetical protein
MRLALSWDPDETTADLDGCIAIHLNVRTCSSRQLHFLEARGASSCTTRPRERCCKTHAIRIHLAPATAPRWPQPLGEVPQRRQATLWLPLPEAHPCHMTIKGFKATTNHKRFIMEDLLELVFQLFLRNKSKGILCWQPQFLIRGYQRKTFDVLLPRGYAFFAGAASHVVFARAALCARSLCYSPHT